MRQQWYGLYSARYGNVYTSRQLLQLVQRATGEFKPETDYWEKDGGYVDPFRPTIPTQPHSSIDELHRARSAHLGAVCRLLEQTDVFVFTLGLTETWELASDGAVFPVAPGVAGGSFEPREHRFINLSFQNVLDDMRGFISRAREINGNMKFLLTVSPVSLMATAKKTEQVVVATSYSKSVLRAVAGQLAEKRPYVDYFPSFEIINSHVMRSTYYEDDLRSVTEEGVSHVMKQFFAEHVPPVGDKADLHPENDDVFCDEELLAAFGGGAERSNH